MIVKFSQIFHHSIYDLENQNRLAFVLDAVIQKTDLSVKALIVRTNVFIPQKKIITFNDIVEISPKAIIVRNEDAISDYKDNIRVVESIREKLHGVNQKVVTKSGNIIGRVFDYLVDSESGKITKIYVKSLFHDRIIPRQKIRSIEKRKIVIDDDFETVGEVKNPAFEPEVA